MNIAIVLFHEVHELDAVGPYSTIHAASRFMDEPDALNLYMVAKSRLSVETAGGLVMTPHWAFASAPEPDILIVPGGKGVDKAIRDKVVTDYIAARAKNVKLTASVCTGAFLLGSLGLLRDLRATTWAGKTERLMDYEVGEIVDARVVKNPGIWCGGGVTAGIDLGLELVRDFIGEEVAAKTAKQINYPFWEPAPTV